MIENESILIISSHEMSVDTYLSFKVLSDYLALSNTKTSILTPDRISQNLLKNIPLTNARLMMNMPSREYVIELAQQSDNIKDIKIDKSGEKVQLLIDLHEGYLDQSHLTTKLKNTFDQILLINLPELDIIETLYTQNADFFHAAKITSFGQRISHPKLEIENILSEDQTSTIESIWKKFLAEISTPNAQVADTALAALFDATANFTKDTSAATYDFASMLVRLGASNTQAHKITKLLSA